MLKSLKAQLKRIRKSLFLKNVATLATGTTLAQAISIFTAPILYRIYDPEDYGTLGLYMAITGVIGVFSTMEYLQPILIEPNDEDAKKVMWLNRFINFFITLAVLIIVILFNDLIANYLNNPSVSIWLYLSPISIFFSTQNQIFLIWANRKKEYRLMSFNAILTAVLVPAVSISIGLLNDSTMGLFMGLMASHILPPFILFFGLRKKYNIGWSYFDWAEIFRLGRKHINYPKYTLGSSLINKFGNNLPVFMISSFSGPAAVGVYSLTARMLGLPTDLISRAIGSVFKEQVVSEIRAAGNCRRSFVKTLSLLSTGSILIFSFILLFGPELFAFVFGEEWRMAGVYSVALTPLYFFKFIVPPLAYLFYIKGKQAEDMIWHIWMLISTGSIFYIGFVFLDLDITQTLLLYAVNYAAIYIIYLFRSYQFSISIT